MTELQRKLLEAQDNLFMAKKHLEWLGATGLLDTVPTYEYCGRTNAQIATKRIKSAEKRVEELQYSLRRDAVLSRWYSPERVARLFIKPAKREREYLTPIGIDQYHDGCTNKLKE